MPSARQSGGDARLAIRNLHGAAELAEADGCAGIGAADLAEQCRALAEARHMHILRALTQDHRILYEIVADRKEIGSSDLWSEYLEHCGLINRRPIAMRTFSNYANRLAQMGEQIQEHILDSETEGEEAYLVVRFELPAAKVLIIPLAKALEEKRLASAKGGIPWEQ